jgi:hypothetical protein
MSCKTVIMERSHNKNLFDIKKGGKIAIVGIQFDAIRKDGTSVPSENCDLCPKAYTKVQIALSNFINKNNNFVVVSQDKANFIRNRCFQTPVCDCPLNFPSESCYETIISDYSGQSSPPIPD